MEFVGTTRFKILRQLGAGGMGVVYEALDTEKSQRVALKTLHAMDPDALFRFKREFRALHGIEHANLVRLGELVEHAGAWFFTMELVPGDDFLSHVWTKDWRTLSRGATDAITVRGGKFVSTAAEASEVRSFAYDETRLRDAMRQLTRAVMAVHDAGKVHRDIKPSNVQIANDGRVVLLDFGLITGMDAGEQSTVAGLCGTPSYMAPEQVAVGRVGPPADWYSVGVMLFEALTGRLPIDGSPAEIMADKMRLDLEPPSALVPSVPEDLDALCLDLLRRDPAARPTGPQILSRLGSEPARTSTPPPAKDRSAAPFIGRGEELAVLDEAWATLDHQRPATVFLHGESGMGKTALLHAMTARLQARQPDVLVFEGRGYEHEAIPYNVFDHVIDALSRLLRALPAAKAAEVMPRHAWLLPRLFPILGRVAPIRKLGRALNQDLDAQEVRARAFSAFREMLARIAERRRLVLILDDLQWAGRDSLMLLGEIMRPPEPPPMLLVLASREPRMPDPYAVPGMEGTRWWALPDDLRRVSLGPLPLSDAEALASLLIERTATPGLDAHAIAEEAEGHPLFVQELVRYAALEGSATKMRPRLDEAIRARTRAMDPTARRVLELTMVASAPIAREVLAQAADLDPVALARELALLEKAHLVRDLSSSGSGNVEAFHNRVREAMLAELAAPVRREHHARLARAYAGAQDPDPVRLTQHLLGAGDEARAARTAYTAAEEAERALAFDRAAELYRLALDRPSAADGWTREVRVKLASALARAGRNVEAADAYAAASAAASAEANLELRGFAAQQYVRAGQFDRGMAMAREVLASLGVHLPKGTRRAALRLLGLRLLARVRGWFVKVRPEAELARSDFRRVNMLHDFAVTMSGVDGVLGAWMTTRALLAAMSAGEPARLARALSFEAMLTASTSGGWTRAVEQRIRTARDLASRAGGANGWPVAMTAAIDFFAGRFKASAENAEVAKATFLAEPGSQFEVAMVYLYESFALYSMGRLADLRTMSAERLRVALDTGERYHAAFYRLGASNVATWLVSDEPARAAEEATVGLASWSRDRFDMLAFLAVLARVEAALYSGKAAEAWAALQESWAPLESSMLLHIRSVHVTAFDARGRAAVARAAESPDERSALLAKAGDAARAIDSPTRPTGPARASLLRASIANVEGDRATERREIEAAVSAFDALGMGAHAAVARRRLGEIVGGEEGRLLIAGADDWLGAQGVRRPDFWARMLAPNAPRARDEEPSAPS